MIPLRFGRVVSRESVRQHHLAMNGSMSVVFTTRRREFRNCGKTLKNRRRVTLTHASVRAFPRNSRSLLNGALSSANLLQSGYYCARWFYRGVTELERCLWDGKYFSDEEEAKDAVEKWLKMVSSSTLVYKLPRL